MSNSDMAGRPENTREGRNNRPKTKRRRRRRHRGKRKAQGAQQPTGASLETGAAGAHHSSGALKADQFQNAQDINPHGGNGAERGNGSGRDFQNHRRMRSPGNRGGAQRRQGRWAHTFAALDLGTNNCRLLVARPLEDGFRVIDAFSRTVRLGEGLNSTGRLSADAMERSVEALAICARKMERRGVTRARCIATEACRTAENGSAFIERVQSETGLTLEIVSPRQEAELAAAGCAPLLDAACDRALVFDIGGGSTELIWLDLEPMREEGGTPTITTWTSLPYGVVTLAEKYRNLGHQRGVNDREMYLRMVEEVSESIRAFEEEDDDRASFDQGSAHLIGNSGTVTTLAAVHLGLKRYERDRVDGVWIQQQDMLDLVDDLSHLGLQMQDKHPCIGEDRADLLLPGCAILAAIQLAWPAERMRVADRGLREGILMALMEDADAQSKKNARRRGRRGGQRRSRRRRSGKPKVAPAAQPSS